MNKTLLTFAALLSLGQTVTAQTLYAGKQLKQDLAASKVTAFQSPQKADTSAMGYWVDAQSYYDANGSYNPAQGAWQSYAASLTLDGDKATITNLVNMENTFNTQSSSFYPMEGVYDASEKTITISAPAASQDRTFADYTKYADANINGYDYTIMLFAGDFASEADENGQYPMVGSDVLVFDVSDDFTTLTPRTGFGLWLYAADGSQMYGCVDFYQHSSITLQKMQEEAQLSFLPTAIHFEGPSVTTGAPQKQTVKLVNKGMAATSYTTQTAGDGLTVTADGTIGAGEAKEVGIQLVPTAAGDYVGTVQVAAPNGSTATLQVTAAVGEAPDFSSIVKAGNVVFANSSDFPFAVTDSITGFPVAVSTNKGVYSTSTLNAYLTVPEGKVGIASWKGVKQGCYANGMKILLDGNTVFDDIYTHGMFDGDFTDDLANTVVLSPGDHVLQFLNSTNFDWTGTADVLYRGYIYDMNFQVFDQQEHLAMLKSDALDFGNHYLDRLSVRDTLTATLVSLGSEPLRLDRVEGNGVFGGEANDLAAAFGEELPVQITFESDQMGKQEGSVTIHTNGGSYTIGCVAANVSLPVDYHPIVNEGDFSFNTSSDYPFAVENGKAYNSTTQKTLEGVTDMSSFLEASFEVPEGMTGVLAWTAHNSSYDLFSFMETNIMTTGTRISLDGEKAKEFGGEDTDASSTQFDADDLRFGPGRHTVRFFYQKQDTTPLYDDRLEVSNLSLTYPDAVERVGAPGQEAMRVEYYAPDGRRIAQPQRGITLVKTIFADGTNRTVKLMK